MYRGFLYATSHTPLIMSFNVEENAVFIHGFSKNLPTVGGGTPLSHTLPPLGRFAPSLCPPLLKNPGYATEQDNDGESSSITFFLNRHHNHLLLIDAASIAVDPEHEVVYFGDHGTDKIEKIGYDGSDVTTIVTGTNEPLYFSIDLKRRYLFPKRF